MSDENFPNEIQGVDTPTELNILNHNVRYLCDVFERIAVALEKMAKDE